ncbi:hypothetical protein BGW36DRAFT_388505 [Talaromyces proteolyticus]|uniref:UBC core domain-containing protein n=1 Tax=Talaromyces proteolyticus TaxID=1131652 RepID=A0AAD4PVN7_9EURO|nr:uncharacterized protein BGW36DRAFT_388505 [Talaromyces proteolyticus]KAH8691538.1 hypothetical protein BGW36DRAFT_388505 [Talaromyces proteolyticus]
MAVQQITSRSGEVYTVPDDTLDIHVLWPPESQAGTTIKADIVAVHGLGGDSFGTWIEKSSKELWLRTFLPKDIANVRIMTFGYNSNFVRDTATGNTYNFAENLLAALRRKRPGEARRRPLIFIGHSLGGIVIKQALITAKIRSQQYKDILESTWHLIFLGTPHQGSLFAPGADFLNKLTSVFSSERTRVTKELKLWSPELLSITQDFAFIADHFSKTSFWEREKTKGLTIVHEGSARLGHRNEEVVGLYADHLTICKFASQSSSSYRTVRDTLILEVMRLDEREATEEHEHNIQELAQNLRLLFSVCVNKMSNLQQELHEMELWILLIRFKAWGQACSLDNPQSRLQELDNPALHVLVENALMRFVHLLSETDRLEGLGSRNLPDMTSSTNTTAFQRLRNILNDPTERGGLQPVHPRRNTDDRGRSEETVEALSNYVDEIESLTNIPAVSDQRQRIIEKEVESISDLSILEQLESARSGTSAVVSEVASIRLRKLRDQADTDSDKAETDSTISLDPSFQTAQAYLQIDKQMFEEAESDFQDMMIAEGVGNLDALSPDDRAQQANWKAGKPAFQIPRWRASSKTAQYGSKLELIRNANEVVRQEQISIRPKKFTAAANRILRNLQQIISDDVKGIRVLLPVADDLEHLHACIEGPPDTPYEGGIFWIDMQLKEYPFKPPKLRFMTRVYHPNIDCRGVVCADFLEQSS